MSWRSRLRPALAGLSAYHVPPLAVDVKLDANESPFPPPPALLAALAEAVRGAHLKRYPDPRAGKLRALVARDLGQPEDRLVFGNGSDELIDILCRTFAAPGTTAPDTAPTLLGAVLSPSPPSGSSRPGVVVYPGPSFVVYRTAAIAAGMTVEEVPLGPRFAPDADALSVAITAHRPNLVFIAAPNNPTGTHWPRATLERLLADHPDTPIVVDEAYAVYARQTLLDRVGSVENLIVLRTYSKIGLAALRLGVLVAAPDVVAELEKVRPPYNLGLLPQLAGELALGPFRDELLGRVADVVAERERLAAALARRPRIETFPSTANLILFRATDGPALWRALADRSVLVRNLHRPGPLANCLRVTVGTRSENDRFLAALDAILQSR